MNHAKSFKSISLILSACAALSITGCAAYNHFANVETANRIAASAWMIDRTIPAGAFNLTAYERMHKRFASADIYIEGDGENVTWFSADTTPGYPVALHLASYDKADNIAYIARPCQYGGASSATDCPEKVLTEQGRYSSAVIDSYNKALDNIAAVYDIQSFNIIAFDGAAAIAAELVKQRHDITSWRTVAGKLDKVAFDPKLAQIPQRHFIGGQDNQVVPAELHNYIQAANGSSCVHYSFIQENEHEDGWADKWPQLLNEPMTCTTPVAEPEAEAQPVPNMNDLLPHYIYTPRDTSSFKENAGKK